MKKMLLICLAALAATGLYANNIKIANVSLTGTNAGSNYTMVQFDLSWDNSWRITTGPANWDAAWVFIKYRVKNDTTWHHATLHYADGTGTGDGHIPAPGATISSSNDNGAGGAYGVFIYHNAAMNQGSVSYPATQLRWDYGVNNVPTIDSVTDVQAYAIEMVYVPQGTYKLGTGGGPEADAFYTYPDTTQPYSVSSEAAIPVGASAGQLYYNNVAGYSGDETGPIPASFPKGFQPYYVMKYEITQDQYTAFLNTLNRIQSNSRYHHLALASSANRMAIVQNSNGQFSTSNPYVACNYLANSDLFAFLDWAALRPLTEMEYEKACRGTLTPVPGEFAWGSNQINTLHYTLTNASDANEAIDGNYGATVNACWLNTKPLASNLGPVRVGIFAANAGNTGRTTAGATYYGMMEMTGNVFEQVVSIGDATSRAYDGKPGDGQVDGSGYQNQTNWPPDAATNGNGGYRSGGNIDPSSNTYTVSDRTHLYSSSVFSGTADSGGRGARTAP